MLRHVGVNDRINQLRSQFLFVQFPMAAGDVPSRSSNTCFPERVRSWCRGCRYLAAGSATVHLLFPASAAKVTRLLRD